MVPEWALAQLQKNYVPKNAGMSRRDSALTCNLVKYSKYLIGPLEIRGACSAFYNGTKFIWPVCQRVLCALQSLKARSGSPFVRK